jgi:hypothetical protein
LYSVALEPTINVKEDPTLVIAKQAREIKELKAELAMHDTLVNRVNVAYDVLTPEQLAEVKQTALRYVRGELADVEVEICSPLLASCVYSHRSFPI